MVENGDKPYYSIIQEGLMYGLSYQAISITLKLSRERVRQLATKYHLSHLRYSPTVTAARQLGVSESCVNIWLQKGKLTGHKQGDRWVIDIPPKQRVCRICGSPIPAFSGRGFYCSTSCCKEGQKYQHRSPEARDRQKKCRLAYCQSHRSRQAICEQL